jgi:hypothetical protein
MVMFALTLACILTTAIIFRQHALMNRIKRARVRKDARRQR